MITHPIYRYAIFQQPPMCGSKKATSQKTSSGEVEGYPAIEYVLRSAHNKTFTLEVRYPIVMGCFAMENPSINGWWLRVSTFLGANFLFWYQKIDEMDIERNIFWIFPRILTIICHHFSGITSKFSCFPWGYRHQRTGHTVSIWRRIGLKM